jgi:tRNA(Ile)-lysidine synthase
MGAPTGGTARTLRGCRVVARGAGIWVVREAAAMAPPVALATDRVVHWDRRFVVYADGPLPAGVTVGGLGAAGLADLRQAARRFEVGRRFEHGRPSVPAIGLPGLPAIRDLDGVLAVPHLNYCRQGHRLDTITRLSVLPDPAMALAGTGGLVEPGWIDVRR